MSGSELISFKVYFDKGDGSENSWEVRRFGIQHEVATNFSYLTEKLKSVFPCLRNASNIHVYWKDAENDCVKISSDAELIIALTETEQLIKKLYIKVLSNENQDDDLADQIEYGAATINCSGDGWPQIHPGIVCDGCDGSLTGFRYKCLQCPDFDLCAACEAKSFHPEHYMLRMPTPTHVDMKKLGASIKKGKCNYSHQKWGSATVPVPSFASGGCPFARKYKKAIRRYTPCTSVDTSVDNLLPLLDKVCISFLQGLLPPQPNSASQQQQSNSDNKNNHADEKKASRKAATAPPFPGTSDEGTSDLTPENINKKKNDQNVSFHSHMFKPQATLSAANCENNSANNNNNSESNENKNTTPNFNSNAGDNNPHDIITKIVSSFIPVISDILKQDVTKVMNNFNQNTGTAPESSNADKDTSRNVTSATNKAVDLSMGNGSVRVNGLIPPLDEQVVQQKDDDNGWTLLNNEMEKFANIGKSTGAIPKTKPNESKSTDDDNCDVRSLSASTDNGSEKSNSNVIDPDQEKFERSLKSMLDMGFTNEGNWLSQLLKNNDCNVAKVIELLTVPANKNY